MQASPMGIPLNNSSPRPTMAAASASSWKPWLITIKIPSWNVTSLFTSASSFSAGTGFKKLYFGIGKGGVSSIKPQQKKQGLPARLADQTKGLEIESLLAMIMVVHHTFIPAFAGTWDKNIFIQKR